MFFPFFLLGKKRSYFPRCSWVTEFVCCALSAALSVPVCVAGPTNTLVSLTRGADSALTDLQPPSERSGSAPSRLPALAAASAAQRGGSSWSPAPGWGGGGGCVASGPGGAPGLRGQRCSRDTAGVRAWGSCVAVRPRNPIWDFCRAESSVSSRRAPGVVEPQRSLGTLPSLPSLGCPAHSGTVEGDVCARAHVCV